MSGMRLTAFGHRLQHHRAFAWAVGGSHLEASTLSYGSFVEGSPRPWDSVSFFSMKTIRQSRLACAWGQRARIGDIVIFDVLGAAPRGSGSTEAAAREDVRRLAESLRAPHEDFNGKAFLIVPG